MFRTLNAYLLIACGGALGSIARYAMAKAIHERWITDFPVGTMAVNVVGSLLIGLIAGLTEPRSAAQLFLMVGVLGGYTTFSSYSLQSVELMQSGRMGAAALYVLGSVALCLLGTWLGLLLAGVIAPRPG